MAPRIISQYVEPGLVRLVWHDFAWIGEESRQAAQGARCAGRQGKFWEYHDHLYANQRGENQGQFSNANLESFAGALGLDRAAFASCLAGGADLASLRDELAASRQQGITATPYFLINRQHLVAGTFEAFARAIDTERARLGV